MLNPINFNNALAIGWHKHIAYKFLNAELIWFNDEQQDNLRISEKQFKEHFSYGIPNDDCFRNIKFNKLEYLDLVAERYGGAGISHNGGGGRCGNISSHQIKGMGVTAMVGRNVQKDHSNGGLDARTATIETILTVCLGKLLPQGTVGIRGLIYIGPDAAFANGDQTWGVLMVRDQCIRPAHFLPARNFKPKNEYKSILLNEESRVKNLYLQLGSYFQNHKNYVVWVSKYLQNSAKQFAFSRIARISHGAVTASNITIDGSWLDTQLSGFIASTKNQSLVSVFMEESNLPLFFADEMLYNYEKYNRCTFNETILADYYFKVFQHCSDENIANLLGINDYLPELSNNSDWKNIVKIFIFIICANTKITISDPEPIEDDPIGILLQAFYLSKINSTYSSNLISGIDHPFKNIDFVRSSANIMDIIASELGHNENRHSSWKKLLLLSLKKEFLRNVFFLTAIDSQVTNVVSNGKPSDLGILINTYKGLASWIFEHQTAEVVIFKNDTAKIIYSEHTNTYRIEYIYSRTLKFNRYADLLGHIKSTALEMKILNFDFSLWLIKIENSLHQFENYTIYRKYE